MSATTAASLRKISEKVWAYTVQDFIQHSLRWATADARRGRTHCSVVNKYFTLDSNKMYTDLFYKEDVPYDIWGCALLCGNRLVLEWKDPNNEAVFNAEMAKKGFKVVKDDSSITICWG